MRTVLKVKGTEPTRLITLKLVEGLDYVSLIAFAPDGRRHVLLDIAPVGSEFDSGIAFGSFAHLGIKKPWPGPAAGHQKTP